MGIYQSPTHYIRINKGNTSTGLDIAATPIMSSASSYKHPILIWANTQPVTTANIVRQWTREETVIKELKVQNCLSGNQIVIK